MDVALYRPDRVRLVSQLEEKLGLKDTPIPALSRAILWLCDLDRLQEMVSNPDTKKPHEMGCSVTLHLLFQGIAIA